MDEKEILSVSQFIERVNKTLAPFSDLSVEGEVSDFDPSRSGKWVGFDLKDEQTEQVLNCFTARNKFRSWGMEGVLEEGMKVQVRGQVKVRDRGDFSMFVKEMDLAGEGTLKKAYEKLKKKLKNEGLFSEERKRALPEFPQRIGLITSEDARAYSDFLKGLKEKIGGINIYHFDVHVQGENAIPEIKSAFEFFNQQDLNLDLIVLLRGGGSLEDLQAFNSEKVARAVFSCPVPVVCGVGHEDDITLAGLTADLRASNPDNAAKLIVPSREELKSEVDTLVYKTKISFDAIIDNNYEQIDKFTKAGRNFYQQKTHRLENLLLKFSRAFRIYKKRLEQTGQQVERWIKSIERDIHLEIKDSKQFVKETKQLLESFYRQKRQKLQNLLLRFTQSFSSYQKRIERYHREIKRATSELKKEIRLMLKELKKEMKERKRLLKSFSPRDVLKRGYSIVEKEGEVVKKTKNLKVEDSVKVQLYKGSFRSLVKKIKD